MAQGSMLLNANGGFTRAKNVNAMVNGVWTPGKAVYVNNHGTWEQVWPYPRETHTFAVGGVYHLYIPLGVTQISIDVLVGAGGGAGSCNNDGDGWVGGGGGSGGYYKNVLLDVVPGEELLLNVGMGGIGASYRFNWMYAYNPRYSQYPVLGGPGQKGGDTYIQRVSNSSILLKATGGGGGPMGGYGLQPGGYGGSPNGVTGGSPSGPQTTGYAYMGNIYGGNNGTGYGKGGDDPGLTYGRDGQDGGIVVSW